MANYGLVLSVVYQPFTYDEITKPLILATLYHREVEKEYGDAIVEASHWRDVANQTDNPIAYLKYKDIMNRVNSLADALTKGGVTPTSSRDAFMVRADVKALDKNFTEAFDTYKEMMKFRNANPAYYMNTYNRSLDSFLGGKLPDNTRVTGKELTAAAAARVGALAETNPLIKTEKLKGPKGAANFLSFDLVMGLPANELADVIKGNPKSELAKAFRQALDDVAVQYELNKYSDADRTKMWLDIYTGAYAGLEKHKYDIKENPEVPSWKDRTSAAIQWGQLAETKRYHNEVINNRKPSGGGSSGGRLSTLDGVFHIDNNGNVSSKNLKDEGVSLGVNIPYRNFKVKKDPKGGNTIVLRTTIRGVPTTIGYNSTSGKLSWGDKVYNGLQDLATDAYKYIKGGSRFVPESFNIDRLKSDLTPTTKLLEMISNEIDRNGTNGLMNYTYYIDDDGTYDIMSNANPYQVNWNTDVGSTQPAVYYNGASGIPAEAQISLGEDDY